MIGELGILLAGIGIACAGAAYSWERMRVWRAGSWWDKAMSEPVDDELRDDDGPPQTWELFT